MGHRTPAETHLATLDLDSSATRDEVKRAYRTLVKVWHPDRFVSDGALRETATAKLARINEAYAWLDQNWDAWTESGRSQTRSPAESSTPGRPHTQSKTPPSRDESRPVEAAASSPGQRQARAPAWPFSGLAVFLVISAISAIVGFLDGNTGRGQASTRLPSTATYGSQSPGTSPTTPSRPASVSAASSEYVFFPRTVTPSPVESTRVLAPPPTPLRTSTPASSPAQATSSTARVPDPRDSGPRITVQAGDTLSRLAVQHGTSVDALRSENALTGDLIRVGQVLRLPDGPQTASEVAASGVATRSAVPPARVTPSAPTHLSTLPAATRTMMERACYGAGLDGPAAFNACLDRQVTALRSGPVSPDLSVFPVATRTMMERACYGAGLDGPAAFNACLSQQVAALR